MRFNNDENPERSYMVCKQTRLICQIMISSKNHLRTRDAVINSERVNLYSNNSPGLRSSTYGVVIICEHVISAEIA
jgi:hypothetical protein